MTDSQAKQPLNDTETNKQDRLHIVVFPGIMVLLCELQLILALLFHPAASSISSLQHALHVGFLIFVMILLPLPVLAANLIFKDIRKRMLARNVDEAQISHLRNQIGDILVFCYLAALFVELALRDFQ